MSYVHGILGEEQYREYGKEISPGFLFLASRFDADDANFLAKHRITHVLNVAEECEPAKQTTKACKVLHIPLRDSPRLHIRQHFDKAFAFINAAKKGNGRCLVHCFEGRNRSASFIIAYLMHAERLTLASAFERAKVVRALVDPNVGFRKQLRDFELEVRSGSTAISYSMTEDECVNLLDLELVKEEDLGTYTDLPFINYEGVARQVCRPVASPPPKEAVGGVPAPKRGAASSQSRASTRSTVLPAAERKPRVASPSVDRGRSKLRGTTSRPVPIDRKEASPASRTVVPPEPTLQHCSPEGDAAALLFDALDARGTFLISSADFMRAISLMEPLAPQRTGDYGAEALLFPRQPHEDTVIEIFRRYDLDRTGTVSRAQLSAGFRDLAPDDYFDSTAIDVLLCAADTNRDGSLDYDEFKRWVMSGNDSGAALLRDRIGLHDFVRRVLQATGIVQDAAAAEAVPQACDGEQGDGQQEHITTAQRLEALAREVEPPFQPVTGTDVERGELSEVLPGRLILTSFRGARDAEAAAAKGVTHIVSVGSEFRGDEPLAGLGVSYLNVVVDDDEAQDEAMGRALDSATEFLGASIKGGGCALVHCAAGISRSATVVLAYLVARHHMSLCGAFAHLRACRRVVWPNRGFMRTLIQWEERHRLGRATMRLRQYGLWSEYNPSDYAAARVVDRP